MGEEFYDKHVCLMGTTSYPNFTKFSKHVTCVCDSVLLCGVYDMFVYICCIVDDVMLAHNAVGKMEAGGFCLLLSSFL